MFHHPGLKAIFQLCLFWNSGVNEMVLDHPVNITPNIVDLSGLWWFQVDFLILFTYKSGEMIPRLDGWTRIFFSILSGSTPRDPITGRQEMSVWGVQSPPKPKVFRFHETILRM